MKRKKLLMTLFAGSMAVSMAVPTMAANVKDAPADGEAYQKGLVTMSSAPAEGRKSAYYAVDEILENAAAKLDQNAADATDIQKTFNAALSEGLKKTATKAEVTSVRINNSPTGNTLATAGDATIGVTIDGTKYSLDVKWGTDVADAMDEAEQMVATSAQTSGGTIHTALTDASNYLTTKGAFSISKLKALKISDPVLEKNTSYTASAKITNASDYVAPTASLAGSYRVTIKTSVKGNGTDVPSSVSASREVTYTITLAKRASVQTIALKDKISPAKIGKAYDINVSINGEKDTSASAVTTYGVSLDVSDTGTAHLTDSTTSNTGKAIVFDQFGTVSLTAATPYGHDTSTTDLSKTKNSTYTLSRLTLSKNKTTLQTYLDDIDKTVSQADASTADTAAAAAKKLMQSKMDAVYSDTKPSVEVSNVISFVPAVAGNATAANGTKGSFLADVTVTDKKVGTLSKQYRFAIAATSYKTFPDVSAKKGDLADAVDFGVRKGIIAGYTDGTFRPNTAVTRAQFVTFLYRLSGAVPVSANTKFTDISDLTGRDLKDAVCWAAANKIATGFKDGTFKPNDTVTREQAAAFLHRYYKGNVTWKETSFTDVKSGSWYAEDVAWGVDHHIINGYRSTRFGTGDKTTRGQAVQLIYRAEKVSD